MNLSPKETRSVCCYCGTGCGVIIQTVADRIVGVVGDPDHPANFGRLCTKGNTLHLAAVNTGRALTPMLRERRAAPRLPVSWGDALESAAQRFADIIRRDGPDAVAFYVSGQLLTEDYYVFNKLARALVGTNNIDSNSRLCMSSAVAAYKATLGADAVPCSYEDIELADLFLVAGANPAYAHPVLFRRIEAARAANPALKLIVVDPRRTDTAAEADLHLAISPGSDVLLYSAMLHVLLWEGMIDEGFIGAHTLGFAALRRQVAELTPGAVAAACGVDAGDIVTAARWFGEAEAPLSFWCQGLNQSIHGTDNGAALVHLHLATGKIGKPGMGPFSLTGQPNAMGGRETGAMANLLPGHRHIDNADDRDELARLWGVPALPTTAGKTAVELFDALRERSIKAVWIACTNPAHSLPDLARVREALNAAEFVVVQDAWGDTETTAYADLLLPATTWGEKDGTVTNSERRISRVRSAVAPPGEARADWRIARDFALVLGKALGRERQAAALFSFDSPAAVYAEHAATTVGRDLDIGGLSHAALDQLGPQQWPFRQGASAGTARLYLDHAFAGRDGRACFVPTSKLLSADKLDAQHPFRLLTGRLRDQWHGMSRTGRVPRLYAHDPEPCLQLNQADVTRRGWTVGALMTVRNRRGAIVLPLACSDELRPGQAFIAMHWGRHGLSHDGVNALTAAAFDPVSKQPELKHATVRIEPAELPWRMTILRSAGDGPEADERVLVWRAGLEALLGGLGEGNYASLTLDGRDRPLLAFRMAMREPLSAERVEEVARRLDMPEAICMNYHDRARHVVKRAIVEDARLTGLLLAGEDAAGAWLRSALRDGVAIADMRRWLFAPSAEPPVASAGAIASRRIVCNCFNVGSDEIAREIGAGKTLEEIQMALKCGTSCGSCLVEIRRMMSPAINAGDALIPLDTPA